MILHFDTSFMSQHEYSPVKYELRKDIRLITPENTIVGIRPYEKFGGSHSAEFMTEKEVHLKVNSTPKIKAITVLDNAMSEEEKSKLELVKKELEKITGQTIKIKYFTDRRSLHMAAIEHDNFNSYVEKTAKMIMENNTSISYESAVLEAKRWA